MSMLSQPLPPKMLIRWLVAIIVILTFLAGYYHSAWEVERQKNQQLQTPSAVAL